MKIQDKIAELQRRAIKEIEEGLSSPDEYTRRRTALDLMQTVGLSISVTADYEKPEEWADEVTDNKETIRKDKKENSDDEK